MDTYDERELAYKGYTNNLIAAAYEELLKEAGSRRLPPEIGMGFDNPAPRLSGKWELDPQGTYLKVRKPGSKEKETIQVTVCPAEGWKPVVSVASDSRDPVTIGSTGDAKADLELLKQEIRKCFERIGL